MADIASFAGIHYDPERVPVHDVIAPPYDVLSSAQQDALYARHPDNIVRLILSREEPGDTPGADRYSRAAAFLRDRRAQGVLIQDPEPGLYEYHQIFRHPLDPGRSVRRLTLFVALALVPYEQGVVLPHEETHPKAKADRMALMRATEANPEPIYGLYEDPEQQVAHRLAAARGAASPLLDATVEGDRHLVYQHTDSSVITDLRQFFQPRRIWIADGHHRYETALAYRQERRESEGRPKEPKPYDFLLIGLSAFEDPGLVVLPTHRLVKSVPAARLEELPLQLERFFEVRATGVEVARAWIRQSIAGQHRFAILHSGGAYTLTLREELRLDPATAAGHCEAWQSLDVTLLQALVLDRCLGISWAALAHTPDVVYTRDEEEAVRSVETGACSLACLLQQPTVTEVRDVAAAGDKMPQKSTFFYPKLWSGLILRSLAG